MPLGTGADLNALSEQQNFGFAGTLSGGHDTASETNSGGPSGADVVYKFTQNSQSSQDAITPTIRQNESFKFGLTNVSNFKKAHDSKHQKKSITKLDSKTYSDKQCPLKFPQITPLDSTIHKFNMATNMISPTAQDLEMVQQPTVYKEMASIESSTKQPNSPQSGLNQIEETDYGL